MSEPIIFLGKKDRLPVYYTGIVQLPDTSKHWYVNGQLHRVNGPAREWPDGSKEWWINDKRHREDGPAIYNTDDCNYWYLDYEFIYHDFDFFALGGNYIVLERGIPTNFEFLGLKITRAKLLTAKGTITVVDNLPGMKI